MFTMRKSPFLYTLYVCVCVCVHDTSSMYGILMLVVCDKMVFFNGKGCSSVKFSTLMIFFFAN